MNLDPNGVYGLDPSHYSGVLDMQRAKDAGIKFVIIKAKNGLNDVRFFKENWEGARKAGLITCSYAWLYPQSVASPGTQARRYLELLKTYPCDMAAIDFEPTYPKNPDAGDLWGFAKPFEDGGGRKPIIYTGSYYWDYYGSVSSIWKEYLLWIAHYGVLAPRVPKPWGRWDFWQYTDQGDGQTFGFPKYGETKCTLNLWRGTFDELYDLFDQVPPPVPTPTPTPLPEPPSPGSVPPGVEYMKLYRFNTLCHVLKIKDGRWDVTRFGYKTVARVQAETGADIVINGGGHHDYTANGWYYVHGKRFASPNKDQKYMPVVNFSKENKVEIRDWNRLGTLYNAIAGGRDLVRNSAKNPRPSADWSRLAARTLIGTTNQGVVVIVVAEGKVEGVDGITLHQAADLMLELGCNRAIDLDGGRSSQLNIEGLNRYGSEEVANHICWWRNDAI